MKIIVDAMGGDNAPDVTVRGAALAAKEYGEDILLVGQPEAITAVLRAHGLENTEHLTIMPASDIVDMHDDPATVLRRKPDSSMAVAFKLLKAGEGDALVSAGNTGALLTGATLYGGRIKGIRRAALAPVLPCEGGEADRKTRAILNMFPGAVQAVLYYADCGRKRGTGCSLRGDMLDELRTLLGQDAVVLK